MFTQGRTQTNRLAIESLKVAKGLLAVSIIASMDLSNSSIEAFAPGFSACLLL